MNKFLTMLRIELLLSLRGMDMFIFAICMPVTIAFLLGIIYSEGTVLEQSFGTLSTISICAGGIMGLPLLISDYRQKKILKRLKVTPSTPAFLVVVWLSIYVIYSIVSLLLIFITLTFLFGVSFKGSILYFFLAYILVMFAMFSIGVMVGGLASDMKKASIIASVLYFPMLLFSDATLPYDLFPDSIQGVFNLLPLTQGVELLKVLSMGEPIENVWTPIFILTLLTIVCSGIGIKFFKWE